MRCDLRPGSLCTWDQSRHPHRVGPVLGGEHHFDRKLAHGGLVWVLVPGVVVKAPLKLAEPFQHSAALIGLIPVCGDKAFTEDTLSYAGGLGFALGNSPGQAGNVQSLNRDRHNYGHEQEGGEDLR